MAKSTPRVPKGPTEAPGYEGALRSNQVEGWKKELEDRVHVFDDTIQRYLDVFVPSSAPPLPQVPLRTPFAKFDPQPGQEIRSYGGLLAGLRKVTTRFPATKLLTFFPNHREKLAFPFEAFEHNHHATFPDIAVSLPGKPLSSADWKNIAAFLEVKASVSDDPFRKDGDKHCRTLVQMAVDARGLIVAHGLLAAFVIGVYGDTARIVRYDHSSVVASPSFSLRQDPEILRQFFWRFVHPAVGDTVVGCDPSTRSLAPHELAWVEERLRLSDAEPLQEPDRCRRVEIHDGGDSPLQAYFLMRLIDINARLLSRATTVWLALKDPRALVDGKLSDFPDLDPDNIEPLEQVIVKDAWRQLVRRNEKLFYDRLACAIPEAAYYGLPRIVCGGDLGEPEVEQWKASGGMLEPPSNVQQPVLPLTNAHASGSRLPSTPSPPPDPAAPSSPLHPASSSPIPPSTPVDRGTASAFFGSPLTPISDASSSQEDASMSVDFGSDLTSLSSTSRHTSQAPEQAPKFPLPYPQHQTFTWRVLVGDAQRHRERSHMRFVVNTVGRRLTRFRTTRELVLAMRDALIGHKLAWKHGKLLHRDMSVGNMLIVEDPETHEFHGFLHDFDYSYMEDLEAVNGDTASQARGDGATPASPPNGATDPARTADVSDVNEDLKERTGTYFFMAMELLEDKDALHTVENDLESVYWVLLWVVLRHTLHDDERGHNACQKVFVYGDDQDSASAKAGHLMAKRAVGVKGNAPLTYLLHNFRELVRYHCGVRKANTPEQPPLSHDTILDIFNKALDMEGWPQSDDSARPVVLESTKTTNVNHGQTRSKSSRKRRQENVGTSGTTGSSKRSKNSTTSGTGSSASRRSRRGRKAS